jgi:hypothetical protein
VKATSYCPDCLAATAVELDRASVACRRCGRERPLRVSDSVRGGVVDVCALCGCGHFYVEKDFNAWLGGAIMLAAVGGFVWAQSWSILAAFGFLAAAALLDLAMYVVCPLRTICYKCLAVYRGARPNPSHRAYDLGIAGRFADDFEGRR